MYRAAGCTLLLTLLGCQAGPLATESGPALGARSERIRIANSLSTQALAYNAISTNPQALPLVATESLVDVFEPTTGDPYLREQLWDVDAQRFMSYLVGCALEPGQQVHWLEPSTHTVRTWEGHAGLCPEWAWQDPGEECRRRVSACVLARVNALGRRVELSLRGEDLQRPWLFEPEAQVPPSEHEPLTGTPVASFAACAAPHTGMGRDCGWRGVAVGQCQAGYTVRLGAGGVAPDQCASSAPLGTAWGARMVLRVCEGPAGCDSSSTRLLAQSQGSCSTLQPAVSFPCPASGTFSILEAPYDSTLSGGTEVEVEGATTAQGTAPVSELELFRVREGAYYGTLFDPKALATAVYVDRGKVYGKGKVLSGPVYKRMFICHDQGWTSGMAYALNRVCALPGSNCAAEVVGTCFNRSKPSLPDSRCRTEDGGNVRLGDGDFEQCYDSAGSLWEEPVTVFLHGPCDLVSASQLDLCQRRD